MVDRTPNEGHVLVLHIHQFCFGIQVVEAPGIRTRGCINEQFGRAILVAMGFYKRNATNVLDAFSRHANGTLSSSQHWNRFILCFRRFRATRDSRSLLSRD